MLLTYAIGYWSSKLLKMPFEIPKGEGAFSSSDAKEDTNDDDKKEGNDKDTNEVDNEKDKKEEDNDEEDSDSDEDEPPPLAASGSPPSGSFTRQFAVTNGDFQFKESDDGDPVDDGSVEDDNDDDDDDGSSVSSGDSERTRFLKKDFKQRIAKNKVKADRLYKNKKWRQAVEIYNEFIEPYSAEDEAFDQDDLQLDSRLHAAICYIKLKKYQEALDQLRIIFRFTPEKDFTADTYCSLCECLFMDHEYVKSACVLLLGLEKFNQDENLKNYIEFISQRYRPSFTRLRQHIAEECPNDLEVKGKDLFDFLETLPDIDDSEYLVHPQDYAKDRQNVSLLLDSEGVHKSEEAPSASDSNFKPGTIAMVVEKAARAYRAGAFGIAAHEFSQALNGTTSLPADVRCILTYCRSMSHLQSRSLDSIKSGLAELEVLASEATSRPYIYYGLAKYLMALKKPESEVVEVIDKGTSALDDNAGDDESNNNVWSFELLSELFAESCRRDQLLKLFEDLEHELKNPATPNAICRHENCLQNIPGDLLPARTTIYLTDVDFKGYYTLTCHEKCVVDFHSQCWKHLKEEEMVSNDKEFLGRECLTPDCLSPVVKIVIVKESGEKKEIEVEDVSSNVNKAPSKWKKNRELELVEKSSQSSTESSSLATSGEGKQAPAAQVTKTIKKPAAAVKTTSSHGFPTSTPSETARKAWPPDPDTCSEFISVLSLQELERDYTMNNEMSISPQLAEMENQNLQLQEEITNLNAKILAFEKEKADLAKKLEDARIHSKRQNEEIARLKGDLAAEQQTTNRLLHQNEKFQSEATTLKKNAVTLKLSQEYVTWQLAHDESSKYLKFLEYLHGEETFLEQSPTLQRCIREYRQTIERTKRQLAVLTSEVSRESVTQIPMPGGLVESDFRAMTAEVDSRMSNVIAKIKSDVRQEFLSEQIHLQNMSQPPPALAAAIPPQSPDRHGLAVAAARASLGVPPAAASSGRVQSIDRIVERVQLTFPSMTKEEIVSKIEVVRRNNNGTIKGLTVAALVAQIGKLIQSQGSAAAPPSADNGKQECAICMEEMNSRSTLMTLQPCGHKFHQPCIKSWFQEKRDCPLCRNCVVPPDDFPHLQQKFPYYRR